MTLAYSYPLLSVFWTMMVFFMWIVFLMALFHVIADIFRSHDMGGIAKTLWLILVLFLPFLGVFIYLISRGDKMAGHAIADAEAQDAAMQNYIRQTASTGSIADDLKDLAALYSSGAITAAEYEAGKAKILS